MELMFHALPFDLRTRRMWQVKRSSDAPDCRITVITATCARSFMSGM